MYYYTLLKKSELQLVASEIIYLTTTYDNLIQICVTQVESIYDLYHKKTPMHLVVLLTLYKRMQPNIVNKLDLPLLKDESQYFLKTDDLLRKSLVIVFKRKNMEPRINLISHPNAYLDQIGLRSKAYARYCKAFMQFDNLSEFLEFYVMGNYDMYASCYDSLLGNKYNFLLLGLLSKDAVIGARHYIKHIWERISENEMSLNDTKKFLRDLHQVGTILGPNLFNHRVQLHKFIKNNGFLPYSPEVIFILLSIYFR